MNPQWTEDLIIAVSCFGYQRNRSSSWGVTGDTVTGNVIAGLTTGVILNDMLGRFLRERRARVDPPARHSRRSATFTQEDLARVTGYSIRTISALEQGAEHRPSPDLLDAISVALRLSGDERSILWYLATGSPPPAGDADLSPDAGLAALVQAIHPHPAYLTDSVFQVQSQNAAFAAWICDFDKAPAGERTILHWFFLDRHSKHVMVNWEHEAAMILARARAASMRSQRGHELTAVIEEICARSPEAERLWRGGTDLLVDGPSRDGIFRRPGHTSPGAADNVSHHVPLALTTLTPMRAGDQRRLVAFLLPAGTPPVLAAQPCPACEER